MSRPTTHELRSASNRVTAALQDESLPGGHWEGELSASALSTATAIAALSLLSRTPSPQAADVQPLVDRGLAWLAAHQNDDGGWGDTVLSRSNISTAMLVRAAIVIAGQTDRYALPLDRVVRYIDQQGGVAAVHARYGKDRTFSAPILTQCALAGLVDWKEVAALPFELAWLPHSFYKTVKLPVVSYALPALIAIGQARHHFRPSRNPLLRTVRNQAVAPTLRKLISIQPASGGFLEATPLTSFVSMSLIGIGQHDHPVVKRGVEFLKASVREDGSWPIDTNLATWVTTLAVNHLDDDALPESQQRHIAEWLLNQQLTDVHPYTQAAPGGWAWTDLSGGVPDADDTPGAILAILKLSRWPGLADRCHTAAANGVNWLLDLQNRDGGWPTFCRGWGALPFDRSSNDITAHALRALFAWRQICKNVARPSKTPGVPPDLSRVSSPENAERIDAAIRRGFRYLTRQQRVDGSWLPLWFGNQHCPDDENGVYGTARVLLAYHALNRQDAPEARRGRAWLIAQQNTDGGWGGLQGTPSTLEETALAIDALCIDGPGIDSSRVEEAWNRGLRWLLERVDDGTFRDPSPIGFYFAKLWYFEKLYPLVFSIGALRRALALRTDDERSSADSEPLPVTIPAESLTRES